MKMTALSSILLVFLLASRETFAAESSGIKVAAVQHERHPYAATPVETLLGNARGYMEHIAMAAEQGAKLVAFPEYGLFGAGEFPPEQENIKDWYAFYLPDEAVGTWNPCDNPPKYSGFRDPGHIFKVLGMLSCCARVHSIAVMVNSLTKRKCPSNISCPNGYQTFNTNIFFGSNGTILAVYHKRHLFEEPDIQPAPEPEYVIVDEDGTQFGSFIGFDVMNAEPAFEYVTKHGIRNLIFSTVWIDELPFHTIPQVVSRFARGMGVNVIASNTYDPMDGSLGIGIYSSSMGALAESYEISTSHQVLAAELPADPLPVPEETFPCDFSAPEQNLVVVNSTNYKAYIMTNVPSSVPWNKTHKIAYECLQNYSHQFLTNNRDSLTLCVGDLCCRIDYEFLSRDNTTYVFAIANHLRYIGIYPVYQQVCSVLRCESEDIETCGRLPEKPTSVQFSSLNITGSFATSAILPSVTGTDLQSFPASTWSFSKGACSNSSRFTTGGKIIFSQLNLKVSVLVASLYGRVFERD